MLQGLGAAGFLPASSTQDGDDPFARVVQPGFNRSGGTLSAGHIVAFDNRFVGFLGGVSDNGYGLPAVSHHGRTRSGGMLNFVHPSQANFNTSLSYSYIPAGATASAAGATTIAETMSSRTDNVKYGILLKDCTADQSANVMLVGTYNHPSVMCQPAGGTFQPWSRLGLYGGGAGGQASASGTANIYPVVMSGAGNAYLGVKCVGVTLASGSWSASTTADFRTVPIFFDGWNGIPCKVQAA